ncbi:MAG: hypothetical protein UHM85_10750 [Acutalibacteraceae bacterium]|nr:hypothetical protein [Acutalibacteraceae bacterium]
MEFIESIYNIVPEIVWEIISYVGTAMAILFLYFSSKHQNRKLEIKWYILAFFFPFITSMVYLSKSKQYNKNVGMKVCPCCGDRYYPNFEICSRCLIELPEVDTAKSGLYKKLSKVSLCLFIVFFLFDLVLGSVAFVKGFEEGFGEELTEVIGSFESLDEGFDRIAFKNSDGEDIYYDRNGEENLDVLEVCLYDREGNIYYFTFEEGEMCFYKDEGEDEWNEDNVLIGKNCFIDESGYFVCFDENAPARIIEDGNEPEYYFEAPYTDSEGNIYYSAFEASWTPEGELITSKEQLK